MCAYLLSTLVKEKQSINSDRDLFRSHIDGVEQQTENCREVFFFISPSEVNAGEKQRVNGLFICVLFSPPLTVERKLKGREKKSND